MNFIENFYLQISRVFSDGVFGISLGNLAIIIAFLIISLLIMSQPDLGSTAIICLLVVAILFYAGISFFQFSLLSILISLLGYLAISSSPMRLARVLAFTDPFAEDIVRNAGWQLSNSLIILIF